MPYLIMGGDVFASAPLAAALYASSVDATPRYYVNSPLALHLNYVTGLCAIIDAAREAALVANPSIPEPLTTAGSSNPAAAVAWSQWNAGQVQYPTLGPGFGGGRNFCDRVGVDSVRSLDDDGDGFTDSPPLRVQDLPYAPIEALPSEVLNPMIVELSVAFWEAHLAGDPRYEDYLDPQYAIDADLPATVHRTE